MNGSTGDGVRGRKRIAAVKLCEAHMIPLLGAHHCQLFPQFDPRGDVKHGEPMLQAMSEGVRQAVTVPKIDDVQTAACRKKSAMRMRVNRVDGTPNLTGPRRSRRVGAA